MRPQKIRSIYFTALNSLRHLYQGNPLILIPSLHPDVTWIRSSDGQCLTGKASVSAAMSEFRLPLPVLPESLDCRVLYTDYHSCTLLSTCVAGHRQKHSVTFLWTEDPGGPKLLHIHGSITSAAIPDSDRRQIPALQDGTPGLIFTGQHAERYYLWPRDILYVEADNISSRLICENRTLQICQSISTVRDLLPDCFVQIHRSYLVNADYILSLRRYAVELQGGITLPVPEKKYKWLREYLDQYQKSCGL